METSRISFPQSDCPRPSGSRRSEACDRSLIHVPIRIIVGQSTAAPSMENRGVKTTQVCNRVAIPASEEGEVNDRLRNRTSGWARAPFVYWVWRDSGVCAAVRPSAASALCILPAEISSLLPLFPIVRRSSTDSWPPIGEQEPKWSGREGLKSHATKVQSISASHVYLTLELNRRDWRKEAMPLNPATCNAFPPLVGMPPPRVSPS